MGYLLNLVYLIALAALSPWLLADALRKGKYRDGFLTRLFGLAPRRAHDRPCAWFHAVSVGEVNLLATLVDEFERRFPAWECVISTTTRTGYVLAQKKFAPRPVFYSPLDFTWSVRSALGRIRPRLLVLAELELWPNLITAASRAGVGVAIVNGRLSERSFRGYCRIQPIVRGMLRRIDLIAAQNEEYAERFRQLGAAAERIEVTGSLKFDGAQSDRDNPATRRLAALAGFRPDDVVFLAGSTQEPEEEIVLQAFHMLADFPRLRLVIVPRHPERFDAVARLLAASGFPWQRRSEWPDVATEFAQEPRHGDLADPSQPASLKRAEHLPRVLLVDTVGELSAWWGTAAVAFVGGSLGDRGGQNMIEPAAYGAAVCFGPNTRNFRDTVAALLSAGGAAVVRDAEELAAFVRRCLEEPSHAASLGENARWLVARNLGATSRTIDRLSALMGKADGSLEPHSRSARAGQSALAARGVNR